MYRFAFMINIYFFVFNIKSCSVYWVSYLNNKLAYLLFLNSLLFNNFLQDQNFLKTKPVKNKFVN